MDSYTTALLALIYLLPVFVLFTVGAALADWLESRG